MAVSVSRARPGWILAALLLLLGNALAWKAVLISPPPQLRVSVLDVGQGDAILIEGPTGIQLLVDGGPDRTVLSRLPREMGLFDRTLDAVVATHPDKDHIAGLVEVLARYRVGSILESGVAHDTTFTDALEERVRVEPDATRLLARRGMRLHLGGGAYADVLFPDREVREVESNAGSIVLRVVYGATSFMLMGDAPTAVEDYLVTTAGSGNGLASTVLKAGHHGSRTSTGDRWLEAVSPQVVVFSAGKENQYGHPHGEVVSRVAGFGATTVSTADSGTLRFVSNGRAVRLE
jgi:competence protein ComEC